MIPYSFHPEAEAEFADAARFYESRGIFRRKFNESFRIFANIQTPARRFVCRFGERWSIDFHTPLSIDAIESQFTFLP